jgi:hypothetical protein
LGEVAVDDLTRQIERSQSSLQSFDHLVDRRRDIRLFLVEGDAIGYSPLMRTFHGERWTIELP